MLNRNTMKTRSERESSAKARKGSCKSGNELVITQSADPGCRSSIAAAGSEANSARAGGTRGPTVQPPFRTPHRPGSIERPAFAGDRGRPIAG
jgi:hypothetical protein